MTYLENILNATMFPCPACNKPIWSNLTGSWCGICGWVYKHPFKCDTCGRKEVHWLHTDIDTDKACSADGWGSVDDT